VGFYDYPQGGKKQLWPGLAELFPVAAVQPPVAELVQRMLHIESVESARCMEEGVLTTARDADVGSILGWGFPPFRGGTISHIHSIGIPAFVAQCDALAARYGERFAPTQTLRTMAQRGQTFYPR
jgi:3-hydroxyacyl-CoA dehydrogenase/enoyl-CoA hydratase/3-hydroxybutyryl-CoA epimerase